MINRAAIRKQLQEGLNTVFGLDYKRYPEQWRKIFTVHQSRKAYEEDVLMSGFGAAAVKPEGQGVSYDDASEVWTARYVNETIALAFAITEEAVEDGLYGDLGAKYARALARSLQYTKEVRGANVLNNGFTAGAYAGGDGVALFSNSHPLESGGTFDNLLTSDLAEAAIEDALILVSEFEDDRGIPVALTGQRLIVGTSLQFTAERLLMSQLRPGTMDNDVNAVRSMGMLPGGYHVNQHLTDTNSWFIITDCPDGLKHFVRKKVSGGMEGDFETGNLRYKKRERYAFGFTDPRGAVGSQGA